jgi:hypothetical protein
MTDYTPEEVEKALAKALVADEEYRAEYDYDADEEYVTIP